MPKTIRLGIFVPTLRFGGGERVASNLINTLSKYQDLEIIVFVYDRDQIDYDIDSNIKIISIHEPTDINNLFVRVWAFIRKIFKIRKAIKKSNIHIALSIMPSMNLLILLSVVKIKKTITVHNIIRKKQKISQYIIHILEKVLYRKADNIVAVSKGVKKSLLELDPLLNIEVIYNPLDLKYIKSKSLEKIDENLNNYIVGIGRLTEQKGFDLLIEAFKNLQDNTLKLVIIGEGPKESELKHKVKSLHLENRVIFLGFQSNPYKYMKNAQCYVLSSRWEGFGLVLAEALATGVKVVSYDCKAGPSEILNNGEFGLLAKEEDIKDLTEKIELALRKSNVDSIKLENKLKEFDINQVTQKYYNLIVGDK